MQDSPNKHGVMGSKSVGEPPLLLSASVLSAFQDALAAAKSGSCARVGARHSPALFCSASPAHGCACGFLSLLMSASGCDARGSVGWAC